jgi:hypothetical protein
MRNLMFRISWFGRLCGTMPSASGGWLPPSCTGHASHRSAGFALFQPGDSPQRSLWSGFAEFYGPAHMAFDPTPVASMQQPFVVFSPSLQARRLALKVRV